MSFIETSDRRRLFYTDWGVGKPVVFVHAWGLNGDMWSYQIPGLVAAGLRCITYDRRGRGRSDRSGCGYDIDTLAGDLAALIERLDLSEVTLIGHSMGAAEVVRCLTRHGDRRIARVVLSAPTLPYLLKAPDNPEGIDEALFEANRALLKQDVGAWLDAQQSGLYFAGTLRVSQGLLDWTLRQILDTPLQILLETNRAFTRADFRAELSAVKLPTLVIHGSADVSAPIDLTGRKAAALIPGSRLVVVENAGHGLYVSEAQRYNAELLAFINGSA